MQPEQQARARIEGQLRLAGWLIQDLAALDFSAGLGIAGIITSDMFGLAAAVDTQTQDLLEEKRQLTNKDELTEQERSRLGQINTELEEYGFRYETRDPVYAEYLKARYLWHQAAPDEKQVDRLPPQQQRRQKALRLVQQTPTERRSEANQ